RSAIESDASLLLVDWAIDRDDIRSWLFGGTGGEILGEAALPSVAVALLPEHWRRVVLAARPTDLLPGRLPSLAVAAELACELSDREHPLVFGPLGVAELTGAGLELPEPAEHADGYRTLKQWLSETTRPGDLVIAPIHGTAPRLLHELHDGGRSVL